MKTDLTEHPTEQSDIAIALEADLPLELVEQDRLNRAEFCKALAYRLANRIGSDSIAVGITGSWGTGKSTIKNFVKHFLGKNTPKTFVIEFNPWEWSGQGKLLEVFLWSLREALGKPDVSKNYKRLSKKIKAYSSALQVGGAITLVWSQVISSIGTGAFYIIIIAITNKLPVIPKIVILFTVFVIITLPTVLDKIVSYIDAQLNVLRKSIDDLREEIEKDLLEIESPIIVFIDDVDRLSKEEIKLLFQLVRTNLRFKNLTFVLLFHRKIVVSALEELTSGYGSDYIGKIIQTEFDVPKASTKDMQSLLFNRLERVIFKGEKKPFFDEARWGKLFYDHLWNYFKSLRDIKRFSSSFEFYYRGHLNSGILEVDVIDLITVEVLRLFDNEAYRKLSRSIFATPQSTLDLYKDNNQRREEFKLKLEEIVAHIEKDSQRERLKALLVSLFPQAGESDPSENTISDWHRRSRICDMKSFHRYFELSIDTTLATQHDLTSILDNASDRSKSYKLLKSAIKNDKIESLLTLILYAREEIPVESLSSFVTALFDIGDELPKENKGWYSTSCTSLCTRFIFHRLRDVNRNKVYSILLDAHTNTTGFSLPIHNLSLEDLTARKQGKRAKDDFLIKEEDLTLFYDINLRKIRDKAENGSLLEHHECGYVIHRWAEWDKSNEASKWIQKTAREPYQALKFLVNLLGKRHSLSDPKIAQEPILCAKSLDNLIDIRILYDAASSVPKSELSKKSSSALELLEIAVKNKAVGENYDTILLRDSEFH